MPFPGLTFIEVERQMPLMKLPVRSAVVQLKRARVLLSPASTLTAEQLQSAGEVTDLVAPCLLHTGGMKLAAAIHPQARLWGPEGSREKHPELTWHGVLGVDAWPHEEELAHLPLAGLPTLRESLFFHRQSGALLVADLVFNVRNARGPGAWTILTLFGTRERMAVSRLFVRSIKDRAAFQRSLAPLSSIDFKHLVPGHGDIVSTDAKEQLFARLQERGFSVHR